MERFVALVKCMDKWVDKTMMNGWNKGWVDGMMSE